MHIETKKSAGTARQTKSVPAEPLRRLTLRRGEQGQRRGGPAGHNAMTGPGARPVAHTSSRQTGWNEGAPSRMGGGVTRRGYAANGRRFARQWGRNVGRGSFCSLSRRRAVQVRTQDMTRNPTDFFDRQHPLGWHLRPLQNSRRCDANTARELASTANTFNRNIKRRRVIVHGRI